MRSVLLMLFVACGGKTAGPPIGDVKKPIGSSDPDPAPAPSKPITTQSLASIGLDPDALDRKVDPCEDFYQFACGGWIAKTEIPEDKPIAMRSFVSIEDRNSDFMYEVLEKLRKDPGKDPIHKQLAAYYGSCMDEPAIERAGIAPIARLRKDIDRITDEFSLSIAITSLHEAGFPVLFTMIPTQDAANAQQVIAGIDQGGLGLPDRDYYLSNDDQTKALRTAYHTYVAALLVDLGRKPEVAQREADAILALETEIARVSKDKVARRDPKGMYNKIDKAGVAKAMPNFNWKLYWRIAAVTSDGVDVTSPEFLAGLDKLLTVTKPETWRAYLTFHLMSSAAGLLPKKFEQTKFKFTSAITGQPQQEVRWKRCVAATDTALADLVGQVFVKERFQGDSKIAAESYVKAISEAMAKNLETLPWMDAQTKSKANAKRVAMAYQIGYPAKWRAYPFTPDPKRWGDNALVAMRLARDREIAKIGKPIDREDWSLSAATVNAYYNAQLNSMLFPAGILQPPFYSVENSIPVNLGAMGMVVGHELTHGFDDQGAQFDAVGNLVNWWQPDTEKQFKSRTQCVIDQYNQYTVAGGGKVNGANTVGENIADIGGVRLAYNAYRQLRSTAPDSVIADGFTEDQQFFLAFGQAWCAKARPDYEKLLAAIDVHSPSQWRVNGTVSSTPDFAKAFRCKAGQKMAPAKQCVIW